LQLSKVQNNSSVRKCTDRGNRGADSLTHVIAQPQLIESSLHQAAAAQSKICEPGSLFLTNWSESMASERGQRKKRRITLTRPPGAYLAGMARQCPRGRPGAAEGRLHRDAPGAPHLALPPASTSGEQALEHPQRAQQAPEARRRIGVLGGGRS
jgi:hypothetical protein